jgi:phosphate transport system substrate-binding protein
MLMAWRNFAHRKLQPLMKSFKLLILSTIILLTISGCGPKKSDETSSETATKKINGEIKIDGSSTVYPITEAVAEEFRTEQPGVKVTVGVSGTGGGFKKFGRGEIDINDASRPIKNEEAETCKANNINHVQLKVAYDGLVIVVNKQNTWVDHFTVAELKKIWEPEAQEKITTWNQIRSSWPKEKFSLYGPGVASGTYDYFTEAVVGKSGASRGDYTASEDDNVLVQGIAGDKNGIAFFGLAYYEENKETLKLVPVDNGKGAITPSAETVKNGTYAPLSRPVFIYVTETAAKRPEVSSFVNFYLSNAPTLVPDVGYIPLTDDEYTAETSKFKSFASAK